jgi:hypothetical protein
VENGEIPVDGYLAAGADALVADGLCVRSGLFHISPEVSLKPLEDLFRARVITFLAEKGLLPPERARMLRG